MCCCKEPNVNGEPGYSWDGRTFVTRQPDPPTIYDEDELLTDDPGRCGGCDSHAYHFRVVRRDGDVLLLVKHGAGEEAIRLGGWRVGTRYLVEMDADDRYWLLQLLYNVQSEQKRDAIAVNDAKWRRAAAEKKIRTRKLRGQDRVKVWIA